MMFYFLVLGRNWKNFFLVFFLREVSVRERYFVFFEEVNLRYFVGFFKLEDVEICKDFVVLGEK